MGAFAFTTGSAPRLIEIAPITTEDLDIVHRRTPENVSRLKNLLYELDAHVREIAKRRLAPQETKTGRAKDRLMLPVLIALAEELSGSES